MLLGEGSSSIMFLLGMNKQREIKPACTKYITFSILTLSQKVLPEWRHALTTALMYDQQPWLNYWQFWIISPAGTQCDFLSTVTIINYHMVLAVINNGQLLVTFSVSTSGEYGKLVSYISVFTVLSNVLSLTTSD